MMKRPTSEVSSISDAIVAEGLVKIYRSRKSEVRALDGLDLTVAEGSVLGLLGPNGAGKTTAGRVFPTLLRPDPGRASRGGLRRGAGGAGEQTHHGSVGSIRGRRREPHRTREPGAVRSALSAHVGRGASARRRAARTVRAGGCRGTLRSERRT